MNPSFLKQKAQMICAGILLLIAGIMGVAVSSIGTECYNKNESFKKQKPSNFSFLTYNLVCAVVLILVGSGSLGFAFYPM